MANNLQQTKFVARRPDGKMIEVMVTPTIVQVTNSSDEIHWKFSLDIETGPPRGGSCEWIVSECTINRKR